MERIVSDQRISSVVDQMASFIYKKIYTSASSCNNARLTVIKYTDGPSQLPKRRELSLSISFKWTKQIVNLNPAFNYNALVLGRNKAENTLTSIDKQGVKGASRFKYLGTLIDIKLTFCDHVDYVYTKGQQCLYLLRKL